MLKIHQTVGLDYYDLQNQYKDENVGLIYFHDKILEGLHFQKHDLATGQTFLDRLRQEFSRGRIVGLYCVTPNDPNNGRHGWIVDDLQEDSIRLLSKYSEDGKGAGLRTAQLDLRLTGPEAIQITDLVFGTPVSE